MILSRISRIRFIERLAEQVLQVFNLDSVPISLDAIIHSEGIIVGEGDFGPDFYGRLEYHPSYRAFLLFHPTKTNWNSFVVRFSIAHELGHYYIPEHRAVLLSGESHNSISTGYSESAIEREADEFAGALLIPETYLQRKCSGRLLTLDLVSEVSNECHVSAIASAIRLVRWSHEAEVAVVAIDGEIKFSAASEEAAAFRCNWVSKIPSGAATWKALASDAWQKQEGPAQTKVWFDNSWYDFEAWEESYRVANTKLTVTLIHVESPDAD
jgi:hypothetical protein